MLQIVFVPQPAVIACLGSAPKRDWWSHSGDRTQHDFASVFAHIALLVMAGHFAPDNGSVGFDRLRIRIVK